MNLKRIIYITKVCGIYGTYISKCLSNLPDLNQDENKFNSVKSDKNSYKAERVRTL